MALVFKTKPGSVDAVEIAGVGLLGANAVGGKLVDVAARQLGELMDESAASPEHPRGKPLEAAELRAAAERFAEDRDLQVVEVPDDELGELNVGIGAVAEFVSAKEVAEGEARRIFGGDDAEVVEPETGAETAGEDEQHEDEHPGGEWAQEPAAHAETAAASTVAGHIDGGAHGSEA